MRIRVAVLNLQAGIGMTEGYGDYVTRGWRYVLPGDGSSIEDASAFLKEESLDIALLTEVEGASRRSRYRSHIETLRAGSGLPFARFFSTKTLGTRINEGSAVLSQSPLLETRTHMLKRSINKRIVAEAKTEVGGVEITVFVAHLALRAASRHAQLKELAEIVAGAEGPIILGGDFNERDHAAFDLFETVGLTHACIPSYPSWNPRHALQALFLSEHFTLAHAHAPDSSRFSDHLPLVVEAELHATRRSDDSLLTTFT